MPVVFPVCASARFMSAGLRTLRRMSPLSIATIAVIAAAAQPAQAFRLFDAYDGNPDPAEFPVLPTEQRTNTNETAATFSLLLAAGVVTTEGFENFPTSQAIDGLSIPISGVGTTLSYKNSDGTSATGGASTKVQKADGNGLTNSGTFPTEGDRGISINSTKRFEVLLDEAIAAFSFWGTDLGDRGNTLTIELYRDTTLLATQPIDYLGENSGDSSVFFFGSIAEDPTEYFNRVVFNNSKKTGNSDAIGLDQFTIAMPSQVVGLGDLGADPTAVPTPALLPGLLGFGLRIWKRRRAAVA